MANIVRRFSFRFLDGIIEGTAGDGIKTGDPLGAEAEFAKSVRGEGIHIPRSKTMWIGVGGCGRATTPLRRRSTRYQALTKDNSKEFHHWMERWEGRDAPDMVIFTEEWLVIPRPFQ